MGLIIDSSVLIAAERSKLNWDAFVRKWSSETLFMAAITLSELWQGYHRATGQHLEKRQNFIREMEMSICVLGFGVDEDEGAGGGCGAFFVLEEGLGEANGGVADLGDGGSDFDGSGPEDFGAVVEGEFGDDEIAIRVVGRSGGFLEEAGSSGFEQGDEDGVVDMAELVGVAEAQLVVGLGWKVR